MAGDLETILVNNELQAWQVLEEFENKIKNESGLNISEVEFKGWPVLTIRIEGEDFHGTVPTRIMQPILDIQTEIHRLYCVLKYDEDNLRRLTDEDRKNLEIVVKVENGSSIYGIVLDDVFNKIVLEVAKNMSPENIALAIVSAGLSFTTVSVFKAWMKKKEKDTETKERIKLSEEETKRNSSLVSAMETQTKSLTEISNNYHEATSKLLSRLDRKDKLTISTGLDDSEDLVIDGDYAQDITEKIREKSSEKMITEEFIILTAQFKPEGNRLEIQSSKSQYKLWAVIPEGVLSFDQEKIIRNNGWLRKKLKLTLLVRELRNKYTSAKLVKAEKLS